MVPHAHIVNSSLTCSQNSWEMIACIVLFLAFPFLNA